MLHEDEQAFAATRRDTALATWVAGRIALSAALKNVGARREPILATARGAPATPPHFVGSVSHKPTLAVAMAAPDKGATVGIDVEWAAKPRVDISARILTERELDIVEKAPEDERWRHVVRCFSIKEAIYKALDPFVKRYVGFKEVSVELERAGPESQFSSAAVHFHLRLDEGPFVAEATWADREGFTVSTARVRRVTTS